MITLNVSCIQRFSTGDGPGIRTTVFLKGCPLRCPWCHNPETISPLPQTLYYPAADRRVTYGERMTVARLVDETSEDLEFYRAGDGGVTVSGGEPLLQSEGVAALFAALKEQNVSTLADTAGAVPWEAFSRVLGVTDLFYYDVKTGDAEKYAAVIGADIGLIKENLRRLVAQGARVRARVPLIPGFNLSREESEKICALLSDAGVRAVDLLPFHRLGAGKYEAMGLDYAYRDTLPPDAGVLEELRAFYGRYFETGLEE